MNKRRIRALRAEYRRTHGGDAPEVTRGTWGTVRQWVRFFGQKGKNRQEWDMGIRTSFARSRRRRMKRAHLRQEPDVARLTAMARQAFRPKKHRRDSNKQDRGRRYGNQNDRP